MALWLWVGVLAGGCEATVTGPRAMVGTVVDASGAPVIDLRIESEEGGKITDERGRFALPWKAPSQFVHFTWRGAWYERSMQPEDEGKVVEIELPKLQDATLRCGMAESCQAELVWPVAEGLRATLVKECKAGLDLKMLGVPRGPPSITCKTGGEALPLQVAFRQDERIIELRPPPSKLTVEIRAADRPPAECLVTVADTLASPTGDGTWVADASGVVTVKATCDGWPAVPRTVKASGGPVTLEWTGDGPEIDLAGGAPWAAALSVVSEGAGEAGWALKVPRSPAGTYRLPPIPAGSYRVVIGEIGLAALSSQELPAPAAGGVLYLEPVAWSGKAGDRPDGYVGSLVLRSDLKDGIIPVEGLD